MKPTYINLKLILENFVNITPDGDLNGLVQDCVISNASAMEIQQSSTEPLIWWCQHCHESRHRHEQKNAYHCNI